jgi:thiamine-phosphate pyrophosphorylase
MIRRMAMNVAEALRLMLVTDDRLVARDELVERCRAAVHGGVTSVQLRFKDCAPRELAMLARELIASVSVPVLINDRLDVALAVGAAGVHLGPDDLPVGLARRAAPAGFLLGASVGSTVESEMAGGADYWGVGPWRATVTKADAGPALGEAGFRRIASLAGGIPCIAIGGVMPEDVAIVRGAGGAGVAVVSGILGAEDVEEAARRYRSS